MQNIKTKVHPLNEFMTAAVVNSLPKFEASKIILSAKERNPNEIRLLTYNTQMIPLLPKTGHKSGY